MLVEVHWLNVALVVVVVVKLSMSVMLRTVLSIVMSFLFVVDDWGVLGQMGILV